MRKTISGLLVALAAIQLCGALAHPGANSSVAYFSHQIENRPGEQSLYIQRGIAYSAAAQYDKALEDFEVAQSLGNPTVVSFDLGVLHYRRSELNRAEAYFDEFLLAYPNHPACLEYRARLRRDRGDSNGSVADFRHVFDLLDNPNPGHYISAAELLESSGDRGIEEALAILDSGLAKIGLSSQLQKQAIRLEVRRERYDLAISRQMTLQPMLGTSPNWKVETAELQQQAGRRDGALRLLEQAADQLTTLRATPARQSLLARIAVLQASDSARQ